MKIDSNFIKFCGTCVICGLASKKTDICETCKSNLPWIGNVCRFCSAILINIATNETPEKQQINICGKCIKKKPPFDSAICAFEYLKPIDKFIISLKFAEKLIYSKILGELLAEKLIDYYKENPKLPEIIIPVPLHINRLRERGYNQALEIAKPISKSLGINIDTTACKRIKNTKAQALISSKNRIKNLEGAFLIDEKFQNKHIAIIDDVMTTGSTLTEISRAFRLKNVKMIDVWCCARVK